MSALTSVNSPMSGPNSGDLFAFDGAEELDQAWRDGLTPDPSLTVSEWADRHRLLSPRASAEPGRYRTDRTPYMRAIVDALSPTHPAHDKKAVGGKPTAYVCHEGRCSLPVTDEAELAALLEPGG